MKIRVEREKIVQALRNLEGIEVVLENEADAKEAIDLIFSRSELLSSSSDQSLKDVRVSEIKEYKTSAVEYKIFYLLEFPFGDEVPLGERASVVKAVQSLFESKQR